MADVIARFDRGPREEIRASLVNREGQTVLDLRVYRKLSTAEGDPLPGPEGISVPLSLFGKLRRAIQAVEEALRRRNMLPHDIPSLPSMRPVEPSPVAVPRSPAPAFARPEVQHLGRTELRLRLECPVRYAVRGRVRREQEPELRHGRTIDISRTGVQVLLPERIPVPTILDVAMQLPVGAIAARCEVVWSQLSDADDLGPKGCRHGLRFMEMGPRELSLLDRLLGEAARRVTLHPE